ncbi:hypothetical protein ACLBWT_18770 [Paenibacillus sp. D51F]
MNLFTHYVHRENHCTNILMNLLAMNNAVLLRPFLERLLIEAEAFDYNGVSFTLFAEHPPAEVKPYEFIIGIAPFNRKFSKEEAAPNPGSIPDAWITGENFSLLLEFKVSGTLNDAQFTSHRRKLSPAARVVEVTWRQVGEALRNLQAGAETAWLISQFCEVIEDLESPRPSSGMPRQIISGRRAQTNEPFFVITGNKQLGAYTVDVVRPEGAAKRLLTNGTGIQANRRWIQQFIQSSENPGIYLAEGEVVIDCCVDPDRKKPAWNSWRLGSF